jgi:DNA-binding transcriptional MerR regulator
MPAKPHASFLAKEVGELVGVSGTTIGQWARRGYIRSSRSEGEPRVYSLEDVVEAAQVRALLEAGVSRARIHAALARLADYGEWPLTDARVRVTDEARPRVVLCDDGGVYAASERGWQRMVAPPGLKLPDARLRRTPVSSPRGRARA